MTWLSLALALLQGLLKALGIIQVDQERRAGAAINQSEAMQNEEKRVTDAANAGAAVSMRPDAADPFDRDRA